MSFSPFFLPPAGALLGWLIGLSMSLVLRRSASIQAKGQRALSAGAAKLAAKLIDTGSLAGHLRNPALLDELKPSIEAHVDTFLQEKLKEKVPVLSVFIGGSTLDKIKAGLLEEIDLLLPEVIGQYADTLGSRIDAGAMVRERIAGLSREEFRELLLPAWKVVGVWMQAGGAVIGLLVALLCVLVR